MNTAENFLSKPPKKMSLVTDPSQSCIHSHILATAPMQNSGRQKLLCDLHSIARTDPDS